MLHRLVQNGLHRLELALFDLEHELIVDLQQDAALEARFPELAESGDHRELDDIGCRALYRRVHRHALGEHALVEVAALDGGQLAAAAEHRRDIARLVRLGDDLVHEGAHARIARKVAADVVARFLARDVQVARESEVADAVDDAEVDGLRVAAQLGRDLIQGDAEDLGGRARVDVLAALERIDEVLVARHVREQAQLDLRVVGRQEAIVPFARLEERADHAALLCAHGDVLEVRVGA